MPEKDQKTFGERLLIVQSKLKAPKGQYNSFGNYNYRSCEDILEAAKPLLLEQELLLIMSDGIEEIGGRVYIVSTVSVYDSHDMNTNLSVSARAREALDKKGMDDAQITGAASSYARKYALNGMFNIDDTKDADTDEQRNDVERRPYVPPARKTETVGPSENQREKIRELGRKAGLDPEATEARIAELETPGDALKAIAKLTEMTKG